MEKVMIRWISIYLRLSCRFTLFLPVDDTDRNDHAISQHEQDRGDIQSDWIVPRFGAQCKISRNDHGNSAENDLIIDRFQAEGITPGRFLFRCFIFLDDLCHTFVSFPRIRVGIKKPDVGGSVWLDL